MRQHILFDYDVGMYDDSHSDPSLNNPVPTPEPPSKKKSAIHEILTFAAIALFIVIPFRIFIAQPFIVNGASMDPTFHDGEYLIVDQITYKLHDPARGDVIIFKYPEDPSKFFIKRVIGLPRDKIVINEGVVTIFNALTPGGLALNEPYIEFSKTEDFELTLESDEYFVMGDNRRNSSDSRVWGALPEALIVGRPFVRLLPLTTAEVLPGVTNSK